MQYWIALLLPPSAICDQARADLSRSQQHALGWWALQFTPRVALTEDAVVLEVADSQRLFAGEEALRERVREEGLAMGCEAAAWAPTAAAALALARAGQTNGFAGPLARVLDALPFEVLSAAAEHRHTLSRLGCRTLADVRRLPRGGLSRRFGKALLGALDRAYGLQPEAFAWLTTPDVFDARLELPGRVELAEALMFGAKRLLMQMSGWLAARHAGVRTFTFRWKHDFHRGRDVPDFGEIAIHTAETTRRSDHFARLLGEQLAKVRLGASVDEIYLHAHEIEPLEEVSASLLQDKVRDGESVTQLMERLSARLGPQCVLRAVVRPDFRPEWAQAWQAATLPASCETAPLPELPQPTWLFEQPIRLAVRDERPFYQGPLSTMSGPHRVEAGWWDRGAAVQGVPGLVRRDYYVAFSEHAGLLWIFRECEIPEDRLSPWYLHGIFG